MDNLINKLKIKKIVIYGVGKFQRDFEYIFDSINVEYYISEEPYKHKELNGKYVYDIEKLKKEELESVLVVICEKDKKSAQIKLEKLNLVYNRNYIFAEDIFYTLDDTKPSIWELIKERKIAVWGTGDTEYNFEQQLRLLNINLEVNIYIDSNMKKNNEILNGKVIKHPSCIREKVKDLYIIIASIYYDEIKNELVSWGLEEEIDFISHVDYINMTKQKKVSELLKETIYAEEIEGPNCLRPFTDATICDKEVYCCCCAPWVKLSIGDLSLSTLDEIWNSTIAKIFRLSIINRTYSFCNSNICPLFGEKKNKMKSEVSINQEISSIPKRFGISIDYSCNLYCESCRNQIEIARGSDLDKRIYWADKIIESGWLEKVPTLIVAGHGEVFLSKVYEKILYNHNTVKRSSIDIITNGNLINFDKIKKLKGTYENIRMQISIDAATEDTYLKLRRGGKWSLLMENLRLLSELRKKNEIQFVQINMVVQKKNFHEMEEFVKMAKQFSFDKALFTKIVNWGTYSKSEFGEISMIDSDGNIKEELKTKLNMPLFSNEIVDITQFRRYL